MYLYLNHKLVGGGSPSTLHSSLTTPPPPPWTWSVTVLDTEGGTALMGEINCLADCLLTKYNSPNDCMLRLAHTIAGRADIVTACCQGHMGDGVAATRAGDRARH